MKKPFCISLVSEPTDRLEAFILALQTACHDTGLALKTVRFPSDGPLGQQIKITTTNRFNYDPITSKALALIDKMDFFFHRNSTESGRNHPAIDILLLIDEAIKTNRNDQKLANWENEINTILPSSDLEFDPTSSTVSQSELSPFSGFFNVKSQLPMTISDWQSLLDTIKKGALPDD